MSFASESGYTPATVEVVLDAIRTEINTQFGTAYTAETFIGTNFYKYFYALAQRVSANEIRTSEIFVYLQQYFRVTNERILRPVATNPGLIEALEAAGYVASVKPIVVGDAGKISICVDVDDGDHATASVTITNFANLVSGTDDKVTVDGTDFTAQSGAVTPGDGTFRASSDNGVTAVSLADQINAHATTSTKVRALAVGVDVQLRAIQGGVAANAYTLTYTDNDANVGATVSGAVFSGGTANADYAAEKLAIATLIKNATVAGAVTQGSESQAIVLSNGQSFDFKFSVPNRVNIFLKLTVDLSENNQVVILSPEDQKALLLANIAAKYRLGKNFEPQRYFTTVDAPWAGTVLLEWSYDESTWYGSVFECEFDDLFETPLENITLVET